MKEILVLDEFTNGHEAAKLFIENLGLDISGLEIVFCGTHENIFQQLSGRNEVYAVVPIYNSIIQSEVTQVTAILNPLLDAGIVSEIGRLDLQVGHCLLVKPGIGKAEELTAVMSYKVAINQCRLYLNSIGIKEAILVLMFSISIYTSLLKNLAVFKSRNFKYGPSTFVHTRKRMIYKQIFTWYIKCKFYNTCATW